MADSTLPGSYRVTIVRRGGFAGLSETSEADSSRLGGARAARLHRLIEAAGLPQGTPDVLTPAAPNARDLFEWEITVHGAFGSTSVTARDDALGPGLRELVAFVRG